MSAHLSAAVTLPMGFPSAQGFLFSPAAGCVCQLLDQIAPATLGLKAASAFEDAHWFKPEGYASDV